MSKTKLYGRYRNMLNRCYFPGEIGFHNYGGRGIAVCDEWRTDPKAFFAWALNNGYDESLVLDRIDNDGDYTPENCRWVTRSVSNRNKRPRRT